MALELGRIVITPGVQEATDPNTIFGLLRRHEAGDWGTLSHDDSYANDAAAFGTEPERVLSAYYVGTTKVWIITEWDRSVTTVLLPDEY